MNDEEYARRFDRLELKIDKLAEVLTNVARVEERLVGGRTFKATRVQTRREREKT